ncbi:MAG: ATP-binding protein, partial [Pseudomonadota bacterium]
TLAVGFDTVKDLSDFNIDHLTDLANIVMDEIELYGRHLIKTQSKANLVTTTELEENKKFLLSIAEVADVGGWELDLKTMAIKWTEKTAEIHEVPEDFVPDFLTAINFYVPEAHELVRKEIRACLYEGQPFDIEVEIITYKKNRKWVRAVGKAIYENGSIIKILGAFQDVTKIRREKQELADALNSRKEALNALSSYQSILDEHAIVSITDLDGKITFTNENFCKISGYTAQELIGEDHSKIKSDVHDDHFFEDMWKTLQADKPWRGDMCNKHKDGSVYWVDTTIIPLKDIDGNVNEYVSMRYDITEKIYHADELVQKRVEAEAANIAKSQFLATTSHEIRTPMNGVMGMLDLTLQTQLTQEQRRHLTVARNSAGNLLEVLNDILDISKLEAGKIDIEYIPFSLQTLLNEIESLFSFKAEEKGIDLRFMPLDPSVPTLIGDPTRIRQVITNLVSNAIKFTKVGYVEICVTYDKAQERISLSIEDTGIGIAEDRIDLLFQRFSQADASMTRCFGGTGLGLAISKQLIEMMGGQISVTSEEGKGSLFSFTLSAPPTSEEITSPSSHNFQDAHEDVLPLN